MNHTDRSHRDSRTKTSRQPRHDAAWTDDRSDDLLPWADPYITSLFDEHRRDTPWTKKTSRDEMAESHFYSNARR
jgi:hypothetical protein